MVGDIVEDIQAKISDFTVEIKGNNELNNYISTQKIGRAHV